MRQFYEGAKVFGATAHRMAGGYDTGEILSQEYEELPEIVTHSTSIQWGKLIKKAIASGMEKAISGQAGMVQDDSQATYAAPFTEDEKWVNLTETSPVILRKTLALNLTGGLAKAIINGQVHKIHSAHLISSAGRRAAGSVIKQKKGVYDIATADGSVRLVTELFDNTKKYSNILPCDAFVEKNEKTNFGPIIQKAEG